MFENNNNGFVVVNSPNEELRQQALAQLTKIGSIGKRAGLEPDDVMSALGSELPTMSADGIYYKTLGVLTRLIRPLGVIVVLAVGLIGCVKLIAAAPAAIKNKLRQAAVLISSIFGGAVVGGPLGALSVLLGLKQADGENEQSPTDALMLFKAVLPGPLASAVCLVEEAFDSLAGSPGFASYPTAPTQGTATAPGGLSLLPALPAASSLAPAPQPVATTASTAQNVPLWQQAVGTALNSGVVGSIISGIGSIFGDEEGGDRTVRDETLEKAIALAVAAGVPADTIKAVLRDETSVRDSVSSSVW